MKSIFTFLCSVWMTISFAQDFAAYRINDPEIGSFTAADFTGDQFVDIIAIEFELNSEASIHLYTNKKESTIAFTGKKLFTKIPFSGRPASGDLDGDGDVDVVYNNPMDKTLTALINDGTGNFTQMLLNVPGSTRILVYDLDKDGDYDIVGSTKNPNSLHVYINNGGLSFTATNIYNLTEAPEAIDIADFDGDGDEDILVGVSDRFNTQVFMYQNNGGGSYTSQGIAINGFNTLYNIYASDVNKDGKKDIVVLTDSDVKILENQGSMTFVEKLLSTGDDRLFTGAQVVDLTGEGQPDIVLGSFEGMRWYKNLSLSDYSYEKGIMNGVNAAYHIVSVDLNNDEAKDVITANGSLWWYQNKITQLPSGTKNETLQTISIYPNPVSDEINIEELSDKIYFLTVINGVGQEVLKTILDYGKANVKSLSSGQYLVVVQDESGKKVGQQIILKQ
ncbi:MAG: FG-GAP-like repeat-containing protein [Saprospiraceae bacterium]